LQNATIVVLFFTTALVLLGSLPFIDARHSDEGFSIDLVPGTNQITFRDSSNMSPQTATLSLDKSSYFPGENVEITVEEEDSDLEFNSEDNILASATSTTSGVVETESILTETGLGTGIFRGQIPLSTTLQPGVLQVTPGDFIFPMYEPEHDGVGRFSAELRGVTSAGTLNIFDYSIDDPDGLNTRHVEACPVDLVTHPVDIQAAGEFVDGSGTIISPVFDPSSEITVTISYANAVLAKAGGGEYLPSELELFWRPSIGGVIGGFASFSDSPNSDAIILNEAEKTITGTLKNFKFQGTLSGQYALGVDDANPCTGGGGGNLVQPNELVIGIASIIGGAVGGDIIPIDTTSLLLAGTYSTAAWMIPVIVSGIGIGIVIARKF